MKEERFEISQDEPEYPESLKELEDAPQKLYVIGDIGLLKSLCVSIIGSRKSTPYGEAAAEFCAEVAVDHKLTVVSGAAIGCDLAAGLKTLECGGRSIAVLGSGADVVYPSQARKFLERLKRGEGLVISEQPWGHKPLRWTFPKRNRIIAALSRALIVVEAGFKSGTSSTAVAAFDLGREVYAVPGSIFAKSSQGCNQIISEGAGIIVDKLSLDVAFSQLYESFCMRREGEGSQLNQADPIIRALLSSPCDLESLQEILKMSSVVELMTMMSAYELDGTVVKLRDGRYSLSSSAYNSSLQK